MGPSTHCCKGCKELKPETEEFWYFRTGPGKPWRRHGNLCRVCKSAYMRDHQAREKEVRTPAGWLRPCAIPGNDWQSETLHVLK